MASGYKPIPYVEPYELAQWMDQDPSSVVVVDVRDTDYTGFKIPNARHIPFNAFFECIPKLIQSIKSLPKQPTTIVFHCMFWFGFCCRMFTSIFQ